MILKYTIAWLGMVILAIINGTVREKILKKHVDILLAHQVSTFTGIVLFGLYTWFLTINWNIESVSQAISIGLIWLVLTASFEFLFGHYIMGHSWKRLFRDYNILKGRLWVLVLIWITIAPYVFYILSKE